jgi:protein gp37
VTKIEWAHRTVNPLAGCTKIAPECANCYAVAMAHRLEKMGNNHPSFHKYEGVTTLDRQWSGKVKFDPAALTKPKQWKTPSRIFIDSMSDIWHDQVLGEWRDQILAMTQTPGQEHHSYLALTKRPRTMANHLADRCPKRIRNTWFGCSAGTQGTADKSFSAMADLAMLGFNTWVSCEPMLCPVDFHGWEFLKWVIIGGESGPNARPFHVEWAIPVMEWAKSHGIPIFFKQMGRVNTLDGVVIDPSPKGNDYGCWPREYRLQQFPPGMVQ